MSSEVLTLKNYISRTDFDHKHYVFDTLTKAKELNTSYFSFVRFHDEYVKEHVESFVFRPLKAAPIGIKDIILTQWYVTSCGSKMLENYVSPYSATCFSRLEQAGGLMIGKTNMDEFAMWSTTETSYFWPTINPHGHRRSPGWS